MFDVSSFTLGFLVGFVFTITAIITLVLLTMHFRFKKQQKEAKNL